MCQQGVRSIFYAREPQCLHFACLAAALLRPVVCQLCYAQQRGLAAVAQELCTWDHSYTRM